MGSSRSVRNCSVFGVLASRMVAGRRQKAVSATNGVLHRLRIEPLESRRMLTTYVVDSLADVTNPDDGVLTLREALVATNAASNMDEIVFDPSLAGGTLVMNGSQFDIIHSTIIRAPEGGSITIDAGGARRVFNVGAVTNEAVLCGLTITSGYWSTSGGGIRCSNGTLTLVNCVVTGNVAGDYGGAIAALNSSRLTIINSTIVGNRATNRAGGVYLDANSTLTMHNSIVAMNQAPNAPNLYGTPSGTSSHNLIGGNPGFVRDPAAGDPGDLRLAEGSPAIDAGDTALLIAPGGQAIIFDVNGEPRVSGSTIDIGACEFQHASNPDERLPGDANGDRTVDAADAAKLASNWGKSDMTWADGDFNDDRLVNAIDAAILAAHFGMTLPVATEATTSEVPLDAATVLVGPLPAGDTVASPKRIAPATARARAREAIFTPVPAATEGRLSVAMAVGQGAEPMAELVAALVAEPGTEPGTEQGTYVPRSPDGVGAIDAALAESSGLFGRRADWVGVLARRHGGGEESALDEAFLAADRLLAQW